MCSSCVRGEICLELRGGLAAEEADRRFAQAGRAGDIGARAQAFYLVDMADRGAHQDLGFHSIVQYAETRYGMPPSTTREYLAVGRALEELTAIDDAICDGRLLWSQVRLLSRIATPETEAEWIRWAQGRTVREIAGQVRRREKGERPTDLARRRIHSVEFKLEAGMSAIEWEIWNTARAKMAAESGRQVSDTEMLMEMARQLLATRPDGTIPGRTPVNDSHFKVHVYHVESLATTVVNTADGPLALDVTNARALLLAAGREDLARNLELRPDDAHENEGPDVPECLRDVETPPELRARVLARDGYRCRCCGSQENLTAHHKKYRRKGGRTEEKNLISVCEHCHSLIHAGLLVVRGSVPHGLRFTDRFGGALSEIAPSIGEALQLIRSRDARASDRAPGNCPRKLTLDDVPDVITPEWWLAHEDQLDIDTRTGRFRIRA